MATALLQGKGYQILETNFHCREGEIDVVTAKHGVVVFVEVKTRQSNMFGSPAEAITGRKLQRLSAAAAVWRQRRRDRRAYRFEAVAILERAGAPPFIEHLDSL